MSYNHSLHDAASLKTNPETGKSGFYLDRKAVKMLHEIELLNHNLYHIRHQLDVNVRDLEKTQFYSTKAKLGWFGSLRRRLNEQIDYRKRRERQIDKTRTDLLIIQILSDRKEIEKKETKLAKLQTDFEARIQWKSEKDEQDYRDWLVDVKILREAKNSWKVEQKKRERERWEVKWQEFLLSKGAKTKVSRGHPELWGSLLL
jgi:hypothetical protein